ncbi:hypothetical protein DVH05_027421 [Phytophthora capsici]|nr:hypothetical protein DVH05_027421 [Phytophthora capsici]
MDAALQQIEQKASLRTDRHLQDMRKDMHQYVEDRFQVAIRRLDDNALALGRRELKTRCAGHHDSITRSEALVVEKALLAHKPKNKVLLSPNTFTTPQI